MSTTFTPLFARVLVKKIIPEIKTQSGLILSKPKITCSEGVVLSVGQGYRNSSGELTPLPIQVGDIVILPEHGGENINFENISATLYSFDQLLGVKKAN